MSMIFPGMDPYLEEPQIWPGVHASMIVYLRDHLQPQLRPRYTASLGERVYVEGPDREIIPDVWLRKRRPPTGSPTAVGILDSDEPELVQVSPLEIHETYIAILDRRSGQKVVTVIELVSPTNKYSGPGRDSYLAKQKEVLASDAHLVEIDLLRSGPHILTAPQPVAHRLGPYDYLVCVNRAKVPRTDYEIYRRTLRAPLPRIRIPLADGDPDVVLDVQAVLDLTYEKGDYRDTLNYDSPCKPALSAEDQAWANQLVQDSRRQAS
jgi:hypothetical protein